MKSVDIDDVGYLYIIKNIGSKNPWHKVGRTRDPIRRLINYNASFPEDVMVYSYVSEKLYNIKHAERELLDMLCANPKIRKKKLEWFRYVSCAQHLVPWITRRIEKLTDTYYLGDD